MADSGKHSALRKTDDGSFELVFDRDGLLEVSEEEISTIVETPDHAPEAAPLPRASRRVVAVGAAGVGALAVLGIVAWFAFANNTERADVDEVPGFRPYAGGAESAGKSARARTARSRTSPTPASASAELAVADDEEITESEDGWELAEADQPDVVVEVEGTDPEVNEVEVEPVPAADAEEGEDADELAELPDRPNRPRAFGGRGALRGLRNVNDISKSIQAPRMPGLSGNALASERMKSLPLRSPVESDAAEGEEEVVDEETPEGAEDEEPEDGEEEEEEKGELQ